MLELSPDTLVVSVADACRVACLSRREIYRQFEAGTIDARKLGRRTLVTVDSLRSFVDRLPSLRKASR